MGRVLEVLSSGRGSFAARDERVVVRVHVDPACPREVALFVKGALAAERPGGVVEVRDMRLPARGEEDPDLVLALVGEGGAELVGSYARSGVPVCVVVEGALDAPRLELPEQAAALVGVVAASSEEALSEKLAAWMAGIAEKRLALATNFPFCRRAVTDALVSRCAVENAAVGAVSLVPGSDLPIMCANQAMLALDIAAAYGCDVSLERAAELAGVLGAGLAWRALARTLVGLVPGIGGLLKAGVGYGGTVATGRALRLRLELEDGTVEIPGPEPRPAETAPARASFSAPRPEPSRPDDGYVTVGEAGA